MNKLIKNGDVVLDGTLTRHEKEKQAFIKLGFIEELMEQHDIQDLGELDLALSMYHVFFKVCEKRIKEEHEKYFEGR